MTVWTVVEGAILAAILLVCLVLAVRWVRRQIRGDGGCGSACGGCPAGAGDCTLHRLTAADRGAAPGRDAGSGWDGGPEGRT